MDSSPPEQPSGRTRRRQRMSWACKACHTRKVRCDAAISGLPCTNCRAFRTTCIIPERKHWRTKLGNSKDSRNLHTAERPLTASPADGEPESPQTIFSAGEFLDRSDEEDPALAGSVVRPMSISSRPGLGRNGQVVHLGQTSNICLLDLESRVPSDTVHYPLSGDRLNCGSSKATDEHKILQKLGAFLLPPRAICDSIVQAFFQWVFPILPILDRAEFMERYEDVKNPPSILLMQAVLLAGTRACKDPRLLDKTGSSAAAARILYKRATSLFEFNYEDDSIIVTQALMLIGWYWDDLNEPLKDPFYWTRNAISVAYAAGLHRSVAKSQLLESEKRLRTRIWWALFTRDRSIAIFYGRPLGIHLGDSDIDPLVRSDFVERGSLILTEVQIEFFTQYVRLCEIMQNIVSYYNRASRSSTKNISDIVYYDLSLTNWLANCPPELRWESSPHDFWSALLNITYCSVLCQLHQFNCFKTFGFPRDQVSGTIDISYEIALYAAKMITEVLERFQAEQEMQYCPAFIVYSIYSALSMHVIQTRRSSPQEARRNKQQIDTCMRALRQVSHIIYRVFEAMVGDETPSPTVTATRCVNDVAKQLQTSVYLPSET